MLERFNRWLDWQIKYHEDKRRAPEILARIRKERGLNATGEALAKTSPTPEELRCAVDLMFLAEARRSALPEPLGMLNRHPRRVG